MRGRHIAAVVAGAVMALTVSAPADAAPVQRISDARFNAIVQKARTTGAVTPAERAEVLTRPELAESTIDPTSVRADYEEPGYVPDPMEVPEGTKPKSSGGSQDQVMALASTSTTSKDRYIVYDNWTGTIYLRYHFVVSWSYDGYQVVGTPSSYTYMTDCGGTCVNYGITKNSQYRNYSGSRVYAWTVPLNAKLSYGKLTEPQVYTPAVRFGVYYNGTYSYTFLNK